MNIQNTSGNQAELFVAEQLRKQKYYINEQNWRTRWCEIDIVASKNSKVYFVEVKYREKSTWGDGLDAITPKKLQQMTFAAESWVHANNWQGDYCLMAASVSGQPMQLDALIEI